MRVWSKMAILAGVAAVPLLFALEAQAQESDSSDVIVVTGTRVADRSALDTAAPVDVIGGGELKNIGIAEVNQALAEAVPSFSFPRPALVDGTDTVRPATLRGLSPDQTLVLVNSKRRHSASLVNINGSIGRGASAVDLNTIPTEAVQSIEVLRDGASAQYGSDAIAGVINVRLKEASSGGGATVSYGWRDSTYEVPVTPPVAGLPITVDATKKRHVEDGEVATVSGWKGVSLGDSGFLTLSGEYKSQNHTERSGYDTRQNYPLLTGGGFDPREATFNRWDAWTGEPEMDQYTFFANGGYDTQTGVNLYGWASYQHRDALSAGFYRRALDSRNVISIYPDGFLPKINPVVVDYSAAFGSKFKLGEWNMDGSLVYGNNKMDYTIKNTLNASIGPTSKTEFDSGGFQYGQVVANLSADRTYNVGLASPLNVAAGLEARSENYQIRAGEPDSYRNGGMTDSGGGPLASGAQVFPGFRPADEVDKTRTSVAAYVDLEANITDAFLLSGAVRGESYSDFGETATGKLAARYDFTPNFALRASVQNGFRAPSLQQQYFSTTSTNFINGVPFDVTTFPVTDPIAVSLGAKPLKAEKSTNYSGGAVIRFNAISVTIDAYQIKLKDRIVLSENLTSAEVRTYLQNQGFIGSGGGRFFINGVDTTTKGVDVVANYRVPDMGVGKINLTFGANFNDTKVDKVPEIPVISALSPAPTLFGRVNVLTFEKGTPKDKYSLSGDWTVGPFTGTARVVRYGEVLSPGTTAASDTVLKPNTLLDLSAKWTFTNWVSATIGADNVFDEYTNPFPYQLNSTGNVPFSGFSPYGNSGRFIYGKLNFSF
ncbi:MAG: TonB-dependent receptor [Alphaproteobacteria bacterium]|nr:TonB-dependent receptor [Alphaproteobacteria bacterium]